MKTISFNLNKTGYDTDVFYNYIKPILEEHHISSFNLGCSFPENIDREEYKISFQQKLLEKISKDFKIDKEKPECTVVIDFRKDLINFEIRSVFVYGVYNKFSRELPQTIHYCYNCYGKGCDFCKNTGRLENTSVQEIISPHLEKEFGAEKSNFIGNGREDINVRMLGNGREFLVELFDPMFRSLPEEKYKILEKKINENKDVNVSFLKTATENDVDSVKNSRRSKMYRALIFSKEPLGDLNFLVKEYEIKQETPKRVSKRRANLVRERKAKVTSVEKKDDHFFYLEVIADSGLYIKEFISSDQERSKPSISQLLNNACECKELDVIKILR